MHYDTLAPYNKECCSSYSTWACTCQQTLRADTDTDTKADLKKRTLGVLWCTLLQLWLAVAYHGDRQLDCSWPLTCALCSARSDFIVGNMRWVQERVHGWGKEALHTVGLHISVSPWAFSPDTAFSPSVVWSTLPGVSASLPRIGAFQLGTVPGWSPTPSLPSSTTGGRKRQKNAARAFDREEHNVSVDDGGVDVMLTCHWPIQLSKPRHFTIWWSTQQPGEDASLTCHLDWTDKHWGWTDLALTLSMNTPSS